MNVTGGGYMSMGLTNSEAVKHGMTLPNKPLSSQLRIREPVPPYATNYGHINRPRSTSAGRTGGCVLPYKRPVSASSVYHKVKETCVTRSAPYAPRKMDSSLFDYINSTKAASIPNYSALSDPHLHEYFTRKFVNMAPRPPSSGRRSVTSMGYGSDRKGQKGHLKPGEVTYNIAVTTGDKKNAGTDARVFIRLKGSKGKLPKKQLKKKGGSVKLQKKVPFRFRPSTTHVFKIRGQDIGELRSLIIEHDGLTKEEGWFLDKIDVEVVKGSTVKKGQKSWVLFPCNQWLSLHESDCQISRELFPKRYTKTEYEITTVTGDTKGAGTDANVFITLYGKSGTTPKLQLKNNSKKTFERNQSDVFHVKTQCVGPLQKVRIEHDNTGFGAGWFLDRVVVTDLNNPKDWKFYFPCGQWLAKDEGDRMICRDLVGSRNPLAIRKANKYKVTVYTGDKRGAGTDANVSITMFGEAGESGQFKLDNSKNNFERNRVDEFIVECPSIGRLERIRIGHDNWGPSAGWYLDKVIIDDLEMGTVYEFPCNRWLAKDEDDGALWRDLVCGVGCMEIAPGIPYEIHVQTGDKLQAGTSARVYIVMYGGKKGEENSGKVWLEGGSFEKGRTDIFNIEVAKQLCPLSRIDIGHDNSGPGPGWFLDRVLVRCASAGVEQVFLCDKWLALDEVDGVIERTLLESKSMRKERKKMDTWQIWVKTSDIRGAGTDANVILVVYGKKDGEYVKSDEIILENKSDNFEQDQVDQFKREMIDVGKPYKIRIGHDNTGAFPGWHLDKVDMMKMGSDKRYTFKCGRWFAKGEDDKQIIREIPAEGQDIKKPQPLVKYHVQVTTGKRHGAGTDANVFVNIFGEQGDTGNRPLEYSISSKNKFEKSSVDEFIVEAVTLKKLKKIRIGHDGKNPGAGWYLEKVVIKEMDSQIQATAFECSRWLAVDEDDGQIVREITAGGSQMLSTTSYHVSVKTGDQRGAGTDANVTLKIFGEKGDTGNLHLKSSDNTKNKFEKGRTDLFKLEATDIGKIEKIRIGHDGKGPASGWFLDEVRIDVPSQGVFYRFACHRWLDENEGDGQTEVELDPTDVQKGQIAIPYEITVWTGEMKSAGTDANVFIQMYGEDGKTEEYKLRNRTDNFEKGQMDKFKIEAADVGPLLKVRIGHDGTGMFSGWFLNKVSIQRHPAKQSKRRKRRKSGSLRRKSMKKVDSGSEDESKSKLRRKSLRKKTADSDSEEESKSKLKRKSSKYNLADDTDTEDSDFEKDRGRGGEKKRKKSFLRKYEKDNKRESEAAEEETEDYWFVCNRWFAKGEDDGKIVRELLPTDEDGKPLDTGLSEVEYAVKVYTGDVFGAGTDANVFINISGEYGDTGERALTKSNNINKFEKSQEDIFQVKAIELGQLKKVKIRHDNKGGGAAWFLGHVEIDDPVSKKSYFFPCQRWLSVNDDDGQIARELVPVDASLKKKLSRKDSMKIRKEIALETKAAMTTYHIYVYTGDVFGAGTDANVYIVMFGGNDDTGKINLKSSKTHRDKFERNNMDEFVVEAVDIGELQKLRVGHDNSGAVGGAWFLDRIEVDAPSLGCKWTFPCGRWLAKDKDDGKLERELYPHDMATEKYLACIPYEITTYTSNIGSASTDADVFIVLSGKDVATQQKSLCSSKKERKQSFKKGAVDKFVLELEDVGDTIEKIRIGHDGSGFGSGWHLDKVEVRRLKETGRGSETYTFPCGRWLAKDEDDGALVRELVPQRVVEEITRKDGSIKKKEKEKKDSLQLKKYNVNVYTGDVRGGGTDANVFLTIFGDKGDSGERKLQQSETYKDKFERKQVDKFTLEAVDLGKVYKVKIRHDNSLINPSWYLDKIEVIDQKDNETCTFHCERWLSKSKDDGKIERSLYVKGYEGDMSSTSTLRSKTIGSVTSLDSLRSEPFSKSPRMSRREAMIEEVPEGPTIPYTIKISTGDEPNQNVEGTDAWIKLYGAKKLHTGRLFLELAQKQHFEPGSIETFSMEAVDVKDVKKMEIGHESVSPSSCWFVKEVEVDMPTKGKHYSFICKQWLARGKGDGRTSRTLTLQDGDSSVLSYKPMLPYEVTFTTGDVQNAGTDSKVFIKVFGANGSTSEIFIDKQTDRFERGKMDLIKMEIDDIAPLKKLRVGHDGKGSRPDWYLEKVEMRNMETGVLTNFKVDNWFSKKIEDGKIVRDVVATIKGREQIKETTYKIYVKTSDVRGAGTDANVYAVIFGENGDSGELHLKESSSNKKPFQSNQLDEFTFAHILSLGQLTKLRIWHDNKGLGAAWHLTHVEIEDAKTKKKYMFPCGQWLSKSEEDKQILRELPCANLPSPGEKDKITYEIEVVTSDKKYAGMFHNAWLILEGERKSSKEFLMENSAKKNVLRRGQTDTFTMVSRNLGKLERCILGAVERDDKPLGGADGREAMWHCHEVAVTDKHTGDKYIFPCKNWINIKEDMNTKYAKSLELKKVEESHLSTLRTLAAVKYEVTVITGTEKGSGTNANVFISVYGSNGDTGKRALTQRMRNLFERGQTDKFVLEAIDLGELQKIRIEHDNSGLWAGWFLDRVEIVNMATSKKTSFICQKWLDKGKGDGEIVREIIARD